MFFDNHPIALSCRFYQGYSASVSRSSTSMPIVYAGTEVNFGSGSIGAVTQNPTAQAEAVAADGGGASGYLAAPGASGYAQPSSGYAQPSNSSTIPILTTGSSSNTIYLLIGVAILLYFFKE